MLITNVIDKLNHFVAKGPDLVRTRSCQKVSPLRGSGLQMHIFAKRLRLSEAKGIVIGLENNKNCLIAIAFKRIRTLKFIKY